MADDRSLSDLMWDYGVYAPIGLVVAIAEEFPRLSEKGKEHAASQIHLARAIGKMAVGQGKRQFGKVFGEASGSRPATSAGRAAPTSSPARASSAPSAAPPPAAASRSTAATSEAPSPSGNGKRPSSENGQVSTVGRAPSSAGSRRRPASKPPAAAQAATPVAEFLAIPGYDTLAASQVVQRLSSLRPDELEAIRRYELATRGRRTILHRIAQLAADR
jgi:hypothetical protein